MLGANEARELLERHGLAARKGLGQNFVTDPGTVRRIVGLAGVTEGSKVVEVGPGLGSLTLALAEAGAHVVAIEKDTSLLPALTEVLGRLPEPRPTVVSADALSADWGELLAAPATPADRAWSLVANLPYNVAVPIIITMLESASMVDRMMVMVQREVAERLCAGPGGRSPGVPTVKVGWFATARIVMSVPPEVFTPRPRVDSAVVEIVRRSEPVRGDRAVAFALVDRAFHQRRKMLRSTLGASVPPGAFSAAGIDPTLRPEQLGVQDWARLSFAPGVVAT